MRRRLATALVALLALAGCSGAAERAGQDEPTTPARAHDTAAASTCATNAEVVTYAKTPRDRRRGLLDHLLPPDLEPAGGLVCRYAGTRVLVARPLTPAAARTLADVVRRMPSQRVRDGVYHCPVDDGRHDVVTLDYPLPGAVVLVVAESGCQTASNGWITVSGVGDLVGALPER